MTEESSGGVLYEYIEVECVGPCFTAFLDQSASSQGETLSSTRRGVEEEDTDDGVECLNEIDDNNDDYLRSLDPKEWKKQDHYAVLGLQKFRHAASANLIKAAYRAKVLKHHPDKRKAKGEVINRDDDYFTCIIKSWEILGEFTKRRSYDSVDPYFDDNLPSNSEVAKGDFFKVFSEYFEKNARWSEKTPVPLLGGRDDSRDVVDRFYSFWYDFQSWREYSYDDEEAKETGQDREERRWIEKQNRTVRAKKKKEEMTRIRSLVDMAYEADPRVAHFKQLDREKKESVKRAKAEAARARVEEEQRATREQAEKEARERDEERLRQEARQKALKSEREATKRAMKRNRKALRDLSKETNYFVEKDVELVKHMEFVEKLCEMLAAKELEQLIEELKAEGREAFIRRMKEEESRVQEELKRMMSGNSKQVNGSADHKTSQWSTAEINLLIKAVNLFPAGTAQRWEVVAKFINQHGRNGSRQITAKEVLSKAKELQTNDEYNLQLKQQANMKAFDQLNEKQKKVVSVDTAETSQRFDSAAAPATPTAEEKESASQQLWTSEEQALLEQALKTYPASTTERWERIAECVRTRSKKECIQRYKDLVQMVRAKKEAEKSAKK